MDPSRARQGGRKISAELVKAQRRLTDFLTKDLIDKARVAESV